jgi:hypothetical protein
LVVGWIVLLRAGFGGLGADHRGLGADQRGLGALSGGAGALSRPLLDSVGVGCVWLLAGGEAEPRSGFVELLLVVVAPFLGVIEGFLADVSGDLLAVYPCLAVVVDAILAVVAGRWSRRPRAGHRG